MRINCEGPIIMLNVKLINCSVLLIMLSSQIILYPQKASIQIEIEMIFTSVLIALKLR